MGYNYEKDRAYRAGLDGNRMYDHRYFEEYRKGDKIRQAKQERDARVEKQWENYWASCSPPDFDPIEIAPIVEPVKKVWYFLIGEPHQFETCAPINSGVWNWKTISAFAIGFLGIVYLLVSSL